MKTVMKVFLLALLSVVACRQASIAVVAPSLEEDFAAIVAGYNEAAGYEAFPLDDAVNKCMAALQATGEQNAPTSSTVH